MNKYFEINDCGHNVRCKLYCENVKEIEKVIIYGHGFGGHKDNKEAEYLAERLISKNKHLALVVFNLPAHGDDVKKKIVLDDCLLYIEMVIKYAKETLHAKELYSFATSFGGYLVLLYIKRKDNPFSKIALRCPAVKMYDVFTHSIVNEENMQILAKGKYVEAGFDRKVQIDQKFLDDIQNNDITAMEYYDYADNVIIWHGTKDEIVSFDDVKEFAENNVIEFVSVENADHRFMDRKLKELVIKGVEEFYK